MVLNTEIFKKLKELWLGNKSKYQVIGNTAMSLILYGLEELLEKEIPCPCAHKWKHSYTCSTFCIPAFSFLLINLLVDPDSRKWFRRMGRCSPTCCHLWQCPSFLLFVFKTLIPSIVWIVLLFLDGDYYACSMLMGKNATFVNETCKFTCSQHPSEIPENLQELCNESRIYGGSIFVLFLALLTFLNFLPQFISCDRSDTLHYMFHYDYMNQKKSEKLIMVQLKKQSCKMAREYSAKKIQEILEKYPESRRIEDSNVNADHGIQTPANRGINEDANQSVQSPSQHSGGRQESSPDPEPDDNDGNRIPMVVLGP